MCLYDIPTIAGLGVHDGTMEGRASRARLGLRLCETRSRCAAAGEDSLLAILQGVELVLSRVEAVGCAHLARENKNVANDYLDFERFYP